MKNFLRALRYSWTYRGRLLLSLLWAGFAALFWSLNFTAITPVLTILTERKSLQDWVDEEIDKTQAKIDKLQPLLKGLSDEEKIWEGQADSTLRDQRRRDLARELAKREGELETARSEMRRYQFGKHYIYRFLPTDPFRTLAWVFGLVMLSVAIKGIFEFFQDSLVGSVVNLSLFDL